MMTKLTATTVPYSSVVGGGVLLRGGQRNFQIMLIGTTNGITKEETEAMSTRIAALINLHGLEVPERK